MRPGAKANVVVVAFAAGIIFVFSLMAGAAALIGGVSIPTAEPANTAPSPEYREAIEGINLGGWPGVETGGPANPYPEAVRVELLAKGFQRNAEKKPREWRHRLTQNERKAFEATLIHTADDHSLAEAACCVPHHFFRYFDAQDRQIGEVAVCLCCACVNFDRDSFNMNDPNGFSAALSPLIESMGVPTDIDCES